MKPRSNELNLEDKQKDLINLIYAVCMSFCELKISGDVRALIRSHDATAKLWFPAGVSEIIHVFEKNNVQETRFFLGSILSIIGSIASEKHSDYPLIHKLLRNRSLETNKFYFILSQLKKTGKDWDEIDIETTEKVERELKINFNNIEIIDIFTSNTHNMEFINFAVNHECYLTYLVKKTAENGCLKALNTLLSITHNDFKSESNAIKLQIKAYVMGASAGALFGYFPAEIGARIGSILDLKDGLSIKSTCKLARRMALDYQVQEAKDQQSTNSSMLKQ